MAKVGRPMLNQCWYVSCEKDWDRHLEEKICITFIFFIFRQKYENAIEYKGRLSEKLKYS